MGYKILGYAVWQGAKWYLRKRRPDLPRKLMVAGAVGLIAAGGAAALISQRRSQTE